MFSPETASADSLCLEVVPRPEAPAPYRLTEGELFVLGQVERGVEVAFRQLRPEIAHGAYPVVIGDDTSARVAALMAAGVLRLAYRKYKFRNEYHRRMPHVRFVVGNRFHTESGELQAAKNESISAQVLRIKNDVEKAEGSAGTALFVTDYISTGSTVDFFIDTVRQHGWNAHVLALSIFHGRKRELEKKLKTKIGWGGMDEEPCIFSGSSNVHANGRELAGVTRTEQDAVSQPLRNYPEYGENPFKQALLQERIEAVRVFTKKTGSQIWGRYEAKYHKRAS